MTFCWQEKTLNWVLQHFYWPGVHAQVQRYCQACPECQLTYVEGLPGGQLQSTIPFEWIGIDIVGPLPKASREQIPILVLVDYTTHYPEAVALRSTTAPTTAHELATVFLRVGLPTRF